MYLLCIYHSIMIIASSFTPRSAHLPLVPSRGELNAAIGQIYPHNTSGVCPNLRLVHTAPGYYGSTAIINIFTPTVQGSTVDVRF